MALIFPKGDLGKYFNSVGQRGFYVTNNLEQAQLWAGRKGSVVHFDVPEKELSRLNIKKFSGPTEEWAHFVSKGRLESLQHSFDGVEGPMIAVTKFSRTGIAEPVLIGASKKIGHQLAIFTEDGAKLFDKHLKGTICK